MNPDDPSPFGTANLTPSAIIIPPSPAMPSPGQEATEPSPNMQLVYQRARAHITSLIFQDQRQELLVAMRREDRRLVKANIFPILVNS